MFLISGDSSAISRTWLPRLVETHEREACMEVSVPVSTPIQQAGDPAAEQAGKCCPTMALPGRREPTNFGEQLSLFYH